ncbi:MAG: hypothetical protein NC489_08465 [Ruminococcus flavefaciens]|nr:hypothetical protein [Ruminococcus flavefaciens]
MMLKGKNSLFGYLEPRKMITQSMYNEGLVEYRDTLDEFLEKVGITVDDASEMRFGFGADIVLKGGAPIAYRCDVVGITALMEELHKLTTAFAGGGYSSCIQYKRFLIARKQFISVDIGIFILGDEPADEPDGRLINYTEELLNLAEMYSTLCESEVMTEKDFEELKEWKHNQDMRDAFRSMHPMAKREFDQMCEEHDRAMERENTPMVEDDE